MMVTSPRRPAVLIVDDSPGVLLAMERLLSPHLAVQVAESGPAALLAVNSDTSLVLSDIRMPGMDGLELMRTLRQGHPNLPVVLMTGVVEDGLRSRARDLGALDVLRKPLRPETLFPSLQEWLAAANPAFEMGAATPALPPAAVLSPTGLHRPGQVFSQAALPGAPAPRTAAEQSAQALLRPLSLLPGVICAGLFTADGTPLARQGEMAAQIGAYLKFLNATAQTLSHHLDAQGDVRVLQMEFADRVLVSCFQPGEVLAILVRDTPAASTVKGWVRHRWGIGPTSPATLH